MLKMCDPSNMRVLQTLSFFFSSWEPRTIKENKADLNFSNLPYFLFAISTIPRRNASSFLPFAVQHAKDTYQNILPVPSLLWPASTKSRKPMCTFQNKFNLS
jgi:hypothetical protein